ncbi:MAG TPA: MOSC N-terminal beta barrel domain-containing protein [Bryobacteraceae bacterium]|jgi:hypothetical protein
MIDSLEHGLERVDSIWRYPVKSMAGETISTAMVTPRGLLGDRAYALIDSATNRAATVRTWGASLLNYRPRYIGEPQLGDTLPAVQITVPNGRTFSTTDPEFHHHLSVAFGRTLTLATIAPAGLLVEFPQGTLGGALSNTTEVPLAGAAPPGTFFDYACVHLIATATLGHLQAVYPEGGFDVRRFRPNMVVRSNGAAYIENSWAGRTLAIGDEVVLRVSIPCPRCVNTTLPQGDLPHDAGILRTIAQHNRLDLGDFGRLPCAGVYADVVKCGTVHLGDTIRFLD